VVLGGQVDTLTAARRPRTSAGRNTLVLERGAEAQDAALLGPGEREALAELGKGEVLGLCPLEHGLDDVGSQESERDDPGDVARGQALRPGDGPGSRLPRRTDAPCYLPR
jgi:hypothetical protein